MVPVTDSVISHLLFHACSCSTLHLIELAYAKAIKKLPQLGYTTGRNSYWLANVARLLDAILTPGQRIERDLMEGLVTERMISCQYCKTSPSPILVTDTRHTRVTSVGESVMSVTNVGDECR